MMQLSQGIGAEIGQRVALEPSPEIFNRVEFGRIRGQALEDDLTVGRIHIVAHQTAAVRPGAVPNDQEPPAIVSLERLEELEHFLFLDRTIVQPEGDTGQMHAGNDRHMIPVEVNCTTGLCPLSAQVRTRVGRCDSPDSSMNRISRPSRWAFF